jgi:hypothetical protein
MKTKYRNLREGELIDRGDQYYSTDRSRWIAIRAMAGERYVRREWNNQDVRRKVY